MPMILDGFDIAEIRAKKTSNLITILRGKSYTTV